MFVCFFYFKNLNYVIVCGLMHMSSVPSKARREHQISAAKVTGNCEHLTWVLGSYMGPLLDQGMLLTAEPTL